LEKCKKLRYFIQYFIKQLNITSSMFKYEDVSKVLLNANYANYSNQHNQNQSIINIIYFY